MATRRQAKRLSLLGNIGEVQRRLRYIESKPYAYRLANRVINRRSIQYRAVANDELDTSSVDNRALAGNAVTSDKIGAGEVKSVNIGSGAVQSGNIGSGQVETGNIDDLSVTTAKLDNLAVTTEKINNLAVTTEKINGLAVTTEKINGLAVTTEKINNSAVTTDKINNLAVTNDKLAVDSVGTGKIRDLNVTTGKIANDAITTVKIGNGQVSSAKIGQGQVRTDNIDTQAVTNVKIAEGTIARNRLSFTPVETVTAGDGLSGGGSARSVTVRVDSSVSRSGHRHDSLYAATNHPHNGFASSSHVHFVSGRSGTAGTPAHSHPVNIASNSPSSLRYKKDITDYTFDLSKLMDLDLKKFRYLNQYKNRSANREWFFGYIAEEVQSLGLEELLAYDQDGLPSGVNYALVGVFTLELVKMQEERIKILEDRLQILSEEN